MPQPEIIAPIVIPAVVTTFLQSVDELTAAWNELQARMESGLELDFTAELEALNDLGVAAMDAYEAVQAADLESFDGVEIALEQLMIVTEEIGYATENMVYVTYKSTVTFYPGDGSPTGVNMSWVYIY